MIYMFSFLIVVSVHCQTCVIEPVKVECNVNFTYQTFALKLHSHNHLLSKSSNAEFDKAAERYLEMSIDKEKFNQELNLI